MLSGIKKGKKKKASKSPPAPAAAPSFNHNNNMSMADQLRQSLASGSNHKNSNLLRPPTASQSPLDHLEQRGLISSEKTAAANEEESVVVLNQPTYGNKREEDMTIQELAARERHSNNIHNMTLDEQMTRNLVRTGKKRRRKIGKHDADDNSDEEVERLVKLLPGHREEQAVASKNSKRSKKVLEKAQQRDIHRQLALHQTQEAVTSKCSWWLESSRFSKHRLLALGKHLSLVMAPPNASLQPGHHFYLVPIQHAESLASCEDPELWNELQKFQTSLNNLYARSGKGIISLETVLHKSNHGIYQTKLELVPVRFPILQEAPIFFQSAMLEQTDDLGGTHTKILKVQAPHKPLRSVLPVTSSTRFSYFSVDWGNVATSTATGYAQILEQSSSNVHHDFGLDTLAGMMDDGVDPIRFRRKQPFSHDQEQKNIADFLEKWKAVDWTTELDR